MPSTNTNNNNNNNNDDDAEKKKEVTINPKVMKILQDYRDDDDLDITIASDAKSNQSSWAMSAAYSSVASSVSSITHMSMPSVLSRAALLNKYSRRRNGGRFKRRSSKSSSKLLRHPASSSKTQKFLNRILTLLSFLLSCYVMDQTVKVFFHVSSTEEMFQHIRGSSSNNNNIAAADEKDVVYTSGIFPDSPQLETTVYSKIDFEWNTKKGKTNNNPNTISKSSSSSSPNNNKTAGTTKTSTTKPKTTGATLPLNTFTAKPRNTDTAGTTTTKDDSLVQEVLMQKLQKKLEARKKEEATSNATSTTSTTTTTTTTPINKLAPHTLGSQWRPEDNEAAFFVGDTKEQILKNDNDNNDDDDCDPNCTDILAPTPTNQPLRNVPIFKTIEPIAIDLYGKRTIFVNNRVPIMGIRMKVFHSYHPKTKVGWSVVVVVSKVKKKKRIRFL
eukprot:CAMPEP_0194203034 /NCGR_PEP_ID=MMETSP0156-20130528/2926_1 /TAXON_ID=33649 /ORGANISM="Thalassionema nitzschioides, Strain L26-B" /LENGTH=443 /DNA_ID=CAMNT_0038928697 /DNA_START=59 /DNA_END=1387 /DNA_ORIENTATION=+